MNEDTPPDGQVRSPPRAKWSRHIALGALLLQLSLLVTAARLMALPLNRVIELRYCLDYFAEHDPSAIDKDGYVPEARCKAVDVVQQNLGWMNGVLGTLLVLCDMAMTAPMGYLINRMGTRVALLLNVSGAAALLLWIATVAAPLFALIGGGDCVLLAVVLTLATTIAKDETQRTSYVAYLTSVDYVSSLFSPSLAALLMQKSLWLPFWVGIGLILISLPLVLLLPQAHSDTGKGAASLNPHTDNVSDSETSPLIPENEPGFSGPEEDELRRCPEPVEAKSDKGITKGILSDYVALVARRRDFQLLLVAFCLSGLSSSAISLLLIYISKRLQWPFARVGYLFTLKAAVNVFMLVICVPAFTKVMARNTGYAPAKVDMLGSKIALSTLAIGVILIGTSSEIWMFVISLVVYAMGSVLPVFMFSLVRHLSLSESDSKSDGRPIALAVFCSSAGRLLGIPLSTALWVRAIAIGGRALGLPFYFSAAGYMVTLAVVQCVRL